MSKFAKNELSNIAGVSFRDEDISELEALFELYAHRFEDPDPPRFMRIDWIGFRRPKRAEMEARRAVVAAVDEIWRRRGGKRRGGYYDFNVEAPRGPLVDLLAHLFHAITPRNSPSKNTLLHDLEYLGRGIERTR